MQHSIIGENLSIIGRSLVVGHESNNGVDSFIKNYYVEQNNENNLLLLLHALMCYLLVEVFCEYVKDLHGYEPLNSEAKLMNNFAFIFP